MSKDIIKQYNQQGIYHFRNKQYQIAASNFRIVQNESDKENYLYFSIMARYNLAMTYERIGSELEEERKINESINYYQISLDYINSCKKNLGGRLLKKINVLEKKIKKKLF